MEIPFLFLHSFLSGRDSLSVLPCDSASNNCYEFTRRKIF